MARRGKINSSRWWANSRRVSQPGLPSDLVILESRLRIVLASWAVSMFLGSPLGAMTDVETDERLTDEAASQ